VSFADRRFRVLRTRDSNRTVDEHPRPDLPWLRLFATSTLIRTANTGKRPALALDDPGWHRSAIEAVQTPG
jgi:hypothetical protein